MEADDTTRAAQLTPLPFSVTSADGVALAGVHLPGPAAPQASAGGTALVVCHGFTHHTGHPSTRKVLRALAGHAPVVAVDLRGHGRSGGRSTVGERELLDLDAAVRWARTAGYQRVVTVGFSLGAAVALCHAGSAAVPVGGGRLDLLAAERPDAVVAVSSPARWYSRESAAMRRVHWLLEQPHGRLVAGMLGVRLGAAWQVVPPSPVEVVSAIAPTPLLLVHFAGDRYFSAAHAHALAAATAGHAQLWTEPGAGHGESGTGPALAERIARWARTAGPVAAAGGPAGAVESGSSTVGPHIPVRCRAAGSEVG